MQTEFYLTCIIITSNLLLLKFVSDVWHDNLNSVFATVKVCVCCLLYFVVLILSRYRSCLSSPQIAINIFICYSFESTQMPPKKCCITKYIALCY